MKAKLFVISVIPPPASVIVMGKRSHTFLHRWMIGSNSERVLRYAHCPVMIVH
jgi:nucleotide-binding universal stress UspA family protein